MTARNPSRSPLPTPMLEHSNYRDYLRAEFPGSGPSRGRRLAWASALQCQTSFVSQVLTDRAHLSLEHAIRTSDFLSLSQLEKKYFMALVARDRAGSHELEQHWAEEIQDLRGRLSQIQERIGIKSQVSAEDQQIYYSHWAYSAIHILSALPQFQTLDQVCERLRLPRRLAQETLRFLVRKGFVFQDRSGALSIGATRIHLPKGAAMLPRHHENWRMKAQDLLHLEGMNDLHYTGVLGISKSDQIRFKERLLKLLEEFEPMIRDSKEEIPVVLLLDLFELK